MTTLLKTAIERLQKLPPNAQDMAAARLLADLDDERIWTEQFEATSDDQWARLAAEAKRQIRDGGSISLEEFAGNDRGQCPPA